MLTPRILRPLTALLLAAFLGGCATGGDPAVHHARGKFETRKTYAEGIGGGAIIGAVGGALLGGVLAAATHRNVGQGVLSGAIIGSVGGAALGGAYASHVVHEREAAAGQEAALNRAIKNASSTRAAAAEFNATVHQQIGRARSNSALREHTLADAQAVLGSVNREITHQRQSLAQAQSSGFSAESRQALQAEIEGLEAERHQLESSIDILHHAPPAPTLVKAR